MLNSSDNKAVTIHQSSARLFLNGKPLEAHYRVAGRGPPLFLLHPSPFSSAFMAPLMRRLAHRATLIAPDTPGFGESRPIVRVGTHPDAVQDHAKDPDNERNGASATAQTKAAPGGLKPYVEAMIALRKALGLDRIAIYGSATGAQIAIEWAKAEPRAVRAVLLDNAASFTDAERDHIMDGYFPDLTPLADGAHLARAWQAAHDATLFFPWQHPAAAHRIAPELGSAEAMDASARAYLEAGPGYQHAYRAAFRNERAQRVQPIAAPVVILRWQGSILKTWSDRFDAFTWGNHVVMAHCGPTLDERWNCLESHLRRVLPEATTDANRLRLDSGSIRYADSDFGQIRYRVPQLGLPADRWDAESRTEFQTQRPLGIAIHGLGASSKLVELPDGGEWIRIDLPGHGGSAEPGDLCIDHCVHAIERVVDEIAVNPMRLAGTGVTRRLAGMVAERNRNTRTVESAAYWPDGLLPDFAPEYSGAHLWRVWYWLRRRYLERNELPPQPERLTQMLLALLSSQAAYRSLRPALVQPNRN